MAGSYGQVCLYYNDYSIVIVRLYNDYCNGNYNIILKCGWWTENILAVGYWGGAGGTSIFKAFILRIRAKTVLGDTPNLRAVSDLFPLLFFNSVKKMW